MAYKDKLSFSFEERPKWRENESTPTTSEMVDRITEFRTRYENLPEAAKTFCEGQFSRDMAVEYIHSLNVGESVGTQNKEDTLKLLMKKFEDPASLPTGEDVEQSKKETMNTHRAMTMLHEKHKIMANTGFLTVQEICDVHEALLEKLHPDGGEIRTSETYTRWANEVHYYPPPAIVKELFYALIDHHNMYMEVCPFASDSKEYTGYIFKCAARLLFEFVDTHPFGDGNGRMCRLLANYVVGLITPFPVALYNKSKANPRRSQRKDYIDAIVRCRKNPKEGPRELAAMLVEGAFRGWENLFQNLERRRLLQPGITIGPIVVQKSKCETKYVSERVDRIWHNVEKRGVEADKERIVDAIVGATKETDVRTLGGTQHLIVPVPVTEGVSVEVHVFRGN